MAQNFKKTSKGSRFFSTTLSTDNKSEWPDVYSIKNEEDTVFQVAAEVKKRLTKSASKGLRSNTKKHSLSLQKYPKEAGILNCEQTQNSRNQSPSSSSPKRQKLIFGKNDIINEKKLLSKVTIHRITSQRHRFQEQTQLMQTSYNYWLNKAQKMKKKSLQEQKFNIKKHSIQTESQRMKEQISKQLESLQEEDMMEKSRLRQTVIQAKIKKNESLSRFSETKLLKASRVRQQSKIIHAEIEEKKSLNLISNKKIYLQEKKEEERHKKLKKQMQERKRLEAQGNFKNRWIDQFNKSSKARNYMFRKKQNLSRKMQYLMEELRSQDFNNTQGAEIKRPKVVGDRRNHSMQDKYRHILLN